MKNILCVSHSSGVPLPSALWVTVVLLLLLLGQKDTPEDHNMYFKNNNSTFNLCVKTLALCWEILSALLQLATGGTRSDSHEYALPLTSFRWPTFRWHVFILNYSFIPPHTSLPNPPRLCIIRQSYVFITLVCYTLESWWNVTFLSLWAVLSNTGQITRGLNIQLPTDSPLGRHNSNRGNSGHPFIFWVIPQ